MSPKRLISGEISKGFPSGWRLDFVTRWLYKRETDDRPSNDGVGDVDWTRYAEVLQELEGKSSEPRVKYRRKR